MADPFFMANDMGWYCADCPTVVIDPEQVSTMLQHPSANWDAGTAFAVVGLVDLDAIPPEQAHLPLDEIDPLPLVRFDVKPSRETLSRSARSGRRRKPRRAKARRKPRRKKRRRR